jgi:hypothetical protein
MLLLLTSAALAGSAPAPTVQATPLRQARAMVVIVKAAQVGALRPVPEDGVKRLSIVRQHDGTLRSAPLIEFF